MYTVGQAAKSTGKSKPTITRAIKSGKISATRNENGSYSIDPAELHRVFPVLPSSSNSSPLVTHNETPNETAMLRVENEGLREQIQILRDERDDLRRRLDAETEDRRKLTTLLTDQRPKKRSWWPFGDNDAKGEVG